MMKDSCHHFLKKGFLVILLIPGILQSQSITNTVQKGYFRNPLGIPMEIVANMGELRANHWHMGLDIRTNQKENQPVYAAAEGYITHIGIRPQSFGRYIIVNHPNGLSTLYAHLNDFFPALEQYVTARQYEQETWAIELDFGPQQFPVSKGQFIAYSGNTGGSQGPHLHFEIFDTKTTKRLNPLLFGFPLQDNVPPDLVKLALYDRSISVYEQTPEFFTVKRTDSGYVIPKMPVLKTGLQKLSFGIQAYDRISGSPNADGIYSAELFVDENAQVRFIIDSIDYAATAYMNAQIDYKYRSNGGAYLQHLSRLPGDRGGVYHSVAGDGVIELADTFRHTIRVEIKDAYKNVSQLSFLLQYDDSLAKRDFQEISHQHFAPNQVNVLEKPDFEVYLPEGCLYDTIQPLYYRNNTASFYAVSGLHQLNDPSIPLHDDITVRIKPDKIIPAERRDKIIIQRNGRGVSNRNAEWQGEWLAASFGDLGTFQAFADVLPPTINELGKGDTINLSPATRIVFTPADNFGIKSFRAELDSQWIRFTNDKSRNWIYVFDERCPYGIHHLKVTVEDMVGNTTTKSWWFKKYPYTPPKKKIPAKKKNSSKKKVTTSKKKAAVKKK
ncbi:MAG: M23 family metallopeptidase [Chitinophagales bacterium]|nr:M23 family metallopeptidase [Chitinophagales bacterium]